MQQDSMFTFSTWPHLEFLLPVELRIVLAAITSLAFTLVLGSWFIRFLLRRDLLERSEKGDSVRLDKLHASKSRTPTLGGVVLIGCTMVSTVLWTRWGDPLVLLILLFVLLLGLLGFADDFTKLRTRKGISAKSKFFAQVTLSLGVGLYLYFIPLDVRHDSIVSNGGTSIFFTLLGGGALHLGVFFVALVVVVTTGASNAVNLTDGLDGLATGTCLLVATAFALVAYVVGQPELSAQLGVPHVAGTMELTVFLGALIGGGFGFLWFNCHPARIFMGDTGALPLGGALGLVAILLKQETLLILVGGVLVAEAGSVILQVTSYRLRKKRIFLCAPLHHHFQFKGWPETKVTARFWLAGAVFALASLWAFACRPT